MEIRLPKIFDRGFHVICGNKGSGKSVTLLFFLNQTNPEEKKIFCQKRDYFEFLEENNDVTFFDSINELQAVDFSNFDIVILDDFNKFFQNSNWNSQIGKQIIQKVVDFTVDTRHTKKLMYICIQMDIFKSFSAFYDTLSFPGKIGKNIFTRIKSRDFRYFQKRFFVRIEIEVFPTLI